MKLNLIFKEVKIKVKIKINSNANRLVDFSQHGDWIDLRAAESVKAKKGETKYIDLGFAMKLPPGYEAIINPRSSSPKNFKFVIPNSQGVIDNNYCGNADIWKCICMFFDDAEIKHGDRICQFRLQLSQNATIWQKIKWLFSSGFEYHLVTDLKGKDRGGFGSTGIA